MYYIIYLLGIIFLVVKGIGLNRVFTNYSDGFTLIFILIPCVLILTCTKSIKVFGESFLYAFGVRDNCHNSCEKCTHAVGMVMITAIVFGGIGFIAGMCNSIRSIDFSGVNAFERISQDVSTALLSLFYPLLIWTILLPNYFILKKNKIDNKKTSR